MTTYGLMLDTNTVSNLLREHPAVVQRVKALSPASLCISIVTKGELFFGLAKRPTATRLHRAVHEFLRLIVALPLDDAVMEHYGSLRASLEREGKILAPLDLLIAAHARSIGIVLVTNDGAFSQVEGLKLEDWTVPVRPNAS